VEFMNYRPSNQKRNDLCKVGVDAKFVQKMSKFKFTCGLLQLSRCTGFLQFIIVLVKLSSSKNTVYLVLRGGSGIISKFLFMHY
jgi:hypothetical protein